MKHRPLDATGHPIRVGDPVRVVGVPDLSGMSRAGLEESLPIFRYLLGKYKRVAEFDRNGLACLSFRIREGRHRGLHSVYIEPGLLRVRRGRMRGRPA
jgi:hypothetical protein